MVSHRAAKLERGGEPAGRCAGREKRDHGCCCSFHYHDYFITVVSFAPASRIAKLADAPVAKNRPVAAAAVLAVITIVLSLLLVARQLRGQRRWCTVRRVANPPLATRRGRASQTAKRGGAGENEAKRGGAGGSVALHATGITRRCKYENDIAHSGHNILVIQHHHLMISESWRCDGPGLGRAARVVRVINVTREGRGSHSPPPPEPGWMGRGCRARLWW